MRALRLLTIVMGVLIVAGVAVVAVTIVRRTSGAGESAPWSVSLEAPRGTTITGVAAASASVAVALHGAAGDSVVVLDPRTGRVTGRMALTPGVAP